MDDRAKSLIGDWLTRHGLQDPLTRLQTAWSTRGWRPGRVIDAYAGDPFTRRPEDSIVTRMEPDRFGRPQPRHYHRMPDGRLVPALTGAGNQAWVEPLDILTADGTQISNTTSETIVCPDFNIPAYYMAPGRTLRIWSFGVNSNVVTTPGTLTYRVRWGGVAGTVLVASAAQGLDTTAHTNALWAMLVYIVCRSAGATGSFMSGGIAFSFNLLASTAANLLPAMLGSAGAPGSSGNVAVTVDTTAAKLLSVTAQFSVSTNPTNLTAQMRTIEVLA